MDTPEVLDPEKDGKAIAVGMTLSTQIGEGRSLVMQTYIPRDASVREYHLVLDKLGAATDRQKAKYDLLAVEMSLAQHNKMLAQLKEDYDRIAQDIETKWQQQPGRRGPPKLNPNEAAQRVQAQQTMKRYVVEIAKLEADRDKLKADIEKAG